MPRVSPLPLVQLGTRLTGRNEGELDAALAPLFAAFDARPFGAPDSIRAAAEQLRPSTEALVQALSKKEFDQAGARQALVGLCEIAAGDPPVLDIAMLNDWRAFLPPEHFSEMLIAHLGDARKLYDALKSAARYYLKEAAMGSAGAPFMIDKNPLNFMHLGLIAALFPNARVIHCRRNPLDTALSVYFQYFAHEANAYAYDLSDIAAVTLEYRRLMEHWYKALPLDIFDLDYEALVKFPEKVTIRLLHYLGLDWEDQVLDFHERDKSVATASLWQVRQPLYTSSIERWKHYEKHLGPITEKFTEAGLI